MLAGAILAGGENRRMNGQVKALLSLPGELMIQRQIRIMRKICRDIYVVTNEPQLYDNLLDPSIRLLADIHPRKGPLSGMHAALSAVTGGDVWIVACDMPFISSEAAILMQEMKQAGQVEAVIPSIQGRHHPLHGIYDCSCARAIEGLLQSGEYRVMQLLRNISWSEAGENYFTDKGLDLQFTTNVNTSEDYRQVLELL